MTVASLAFQPAFGRFQDTFRSAGKVAPQLRRALAGLQADEFIRLEGPQSAGEPDASAPQPVMTLGIDTLTNMAVNIRRHASGGLSVGLAPDASYTQNVSPLFATRVQVQNPAFADGQRVNLSQHALDMGQGPFDVLIHHTDFSRPPTVVRTDREVVLRGWADEGLVVMNEYPKTTDRLRLPTWRFNLDWLTKPLASLWHFGMGGFFGNKRPSVHV